MRATRAVLAVSVVVGLSALGVLAQEDDGVLRARPPQTPETGRLIRPDRRPVTPGLSNLDRDRPPMPAPRPSVHGDYTPVFIPIVDGRLAYWPWRHRPGTSIRLDFGDFTYSYTSRTYDPFYYWWGGYRRPDSRIYVMLGTREEPDTVYYYGTDLPSYYAPTYVFTQAPAAGVQLDTPTARAEPVGPPAAEEVTVRRPPEGFASRLAPMLGARDGVSLEFAVGESLLRSGRYAEAADYMRQAVAATPEAPEAKLALALALIGADDYRAAAHILRRGLRAMADWGTIALEPEGAFAGPRASQEVEARVLEAAEAEPNEDVVLLAVFLAYARGDMDAATDRARRFGQGLEDDLLRALAAEAARSAR